MIDHYQLGTVVRMKKKHPCGSEAWEVIRLGADIKIKCLGCGRMVMLPRSKFEKDAKKILRQPEDTE
ncbi:protein involved in chromosome partitioning [Clostridiaceae bacterium JG1575]|nr:protein involved in chromosome partitioning [Clostridiaceae bacterium JG1575]